MDGVATVTMDMCVFGMSAKDACGHEGVVKKPTRWMSNAPALFHELGVRCGRARAAHLPLLGSRVAAAARSPTRL